MGATIALELLLAFEGIAGERNGDQARGRDRLIGDLAGSVGALLHALDRIGDLLEGFLLVRDERKGEVAVGGVGTGVSQVLRVAGKVAGIVLARLLERFLGVEGQALVERVAHVHEEAIVAAELLRHLLRLVDEAFSLAEGIGAAEQVGDGGGRDVVRTGPLRTGGGGGLLARLALFVRHPDVELGLRLVALLEVGLQVGERVELELRARGDDEGVDLMMIVAMLVEQALLDGMVDLGSLGGLRAFGDRRGLGVLRRSSRSGALLSLRRNHRRRLGGLDRSGRLALGRRRLGDGLGSRLRFGLGGGSGLLGGLLGIVFLGHRKGGLELLVLGE